MNTNTNRRRLGDRAAAEYPATGVGDTTTVAPAADDVAAILARVDLEADDWWRPCALAGVKHLAAIGQPFTAYDVAALGVPDPDHPNRWGALFSAAAAAGTVVPVAVVRGSRPTTHRALVRQWIGAQHAEGAA